MNPICSSVLLLSLLLVSPALSVTVNLGTGYTADITATGATGSRELTVELTLID